MERIFFGISVFVLYCLMGMPAIAQCDDNIIPSSESPISYRQLQNRCEGFYRAEVSSSLEVVGFIKGIFRYELSSNEQIEIIVDTLDEINVRAVGIPMTLYYRMDGRASRGNSLIWKVGDVLHKAHIQSRNIGIYGWIQDGLDKVYIPVQTKATSNQFQGTDDTYRIYLRSPYKLSELRWRVCRSDGCSAYTEYGNSIMAGQPVVLVLPQNISGDMVLEIALIKWGDTDFDKDEIHFKI